jgi:hypothetical protein
MSDLYRVARGRFMGVVRLSGIDLSEIDLSEHISRNPGLSFWSLLLSLQMEQKVKKTLAKKEPSEEEQTPAA